MIHKLKTDIDPDRPLSTLMRAFGELTYGNMNPTRIYSSRNVALKVARLLPEFGEVKDDLIRESGFMFQGAYWTPVDFLKEGLVVFENSFHPNDPKLNGWMELFPYTESVTK